MKSLSSTLLQFSSSSHLDFPWASAERSLGLSNDMDTVVPPQVTAELTQILSNLVLGDNEIRSK